MCLLESFCGQPASQEKSGENQAAANKHSQIIHFNLLPWHQKEVTGLEPATVDDCTYLCLVERSIHLSYTSL